MSRLLLLGGTAEAREIAQALAGRVDGVLSLAGRTRAPERDGMPTRIGGFGGADGFARYLREAEIGRILDATHPFAAEMSRRSARVAAECVVPYLMLRRPGWTAVAGDRWYRVPDTAAAARVPGPRDRVFLATGRQTLTDFAQMEAAYCWCRQIDPPEEAFPFENGEFLVARPPFPVEDELALFRRLGVTVLVVKDAGGAASRSKLDAARALGIRVVMIDRPDLSELPQVETVAAALAWVEGASCPSDA
ncbi:cobalt-precorrin-6A reductase [Dinoroseobacter sp. PD6]|uniref:cobalt-precorrin-6A reductase n=1 Tax=Dinoroseobacter sp. PD6 TaxID=3028384 RepID=UPI00237C3E0F|nr:cobalt-precorrin-6A reductase [Dinoroseobacter sp. PD6]MDD9715473.1 cobalt-precorrin-6A reductase [Dinoroseobacter sp. PD6]